MIHSRIKQDGVIILSNLGEERKFNVTLDTDRLGMRPTQAVVLEGNGQVTLEGTTLSARVPRHDYRLILIKE